MNEYDSSYVNRLSKSSDTEALFKYLLPFVEHGNVQAMLDIALIYAQRRNLEKCQFFVSQAEKTLLDSLVSLWSAFRAGWMGGEMEEQDGKALRYLTWLGESGNVHAQEILMLDYLKGINGVSPNADSFLFWANKAAQNGSKLATSEVRKFKRAKLK